MFACQLLLMVTWGTQYYYIDLTAYPSNPTWPPPPPNKVYPYLLRASQPSCLSIKEEVSLVQGPIVLIAEQSAAEKAWSGTWSFGLLGTVSCSEYKAKLYDFEVIIINILSDRQNMRTNFLKQRNTHVSCAR